MIHPERFSDQVAIVTGAASGIGQAIAMRLGEEGASVALFDVNTKGLEATTAMMSAKKIACKAYGVDVSGEEEVSRNIQEVMDDMGRLDVVVHAAGIVGPTSTRITEYPTDDFERIIAVNLKGSFLITKHAIPHMAKRNYGRILLIASIAGKEGNPGMVGYSATKAGMLGLIKGVGKEYASTGITVNGLAPAVIKTAMNADTSKEQLEYMTSRIPMNRLGTVEEVAALSCFIVSSENSFTTGFVYDISGGRAVY